MKGNEIDEIEFLELLRKHLRIRFQAYIHRLKGNPCSAIDFQMFFIFFFSNILIIDSFKDVFKLLLKISAVEKLK